MSPATRSRSCSVAFARSVTLAALLVLSVCSVSQDRQATAPDDRKPEENEIKQMISRYTKAADEADPTVASHVWCDSSEDSLINPIGRWHGVEQIMGFYRHQMGDTYLARNLKISDISVQVYSDSAWSEFNWDFAAKLKKDGSPVSFHGMETQIYRKTHNGWCLVHVHYSALPAEAKTTGTN